jgi:hypothetical protein
VLGLQLFEVVGNVVGYSVNVDGCMVGVSGECFEIGSLECCENTCDLLVSRDKAVLNVGNQA